MGRYGDHIQLKSGAVDLRSFNKHSFVVKSQAESIKDESARRLMTDLFEIITEGNHDNSDAMTDYFDIGWYTTVEVGAYDKPYQFIG